MIIMSNDNDDDNKIIVDIDVCDCQIRASKPDIQTTMPIPDDAAKELFWNTVPVDRLNKHVYGDLKGSARQKAAEVVERYGAINMPGIYGSIEIDEKDFVQWEADT